MTTPEILAVIRDLTVTLGLPSLLVVVERLRRREIDSMAAQIKLLERQSAPEMANAVDGYKRLLAQRSEELGARIAELEEAHSLKTEELLRLQGQLQSVETDRNVVTLVESQLRSPASDPLRRVCELVTVARTQLRTYVSEVLLPECVESARREYEYSDEEQAVLAERANEKVIEALHANKLHCEWQCWKNSAAEAAAPQRGAASL